MDDSPRGLSLPQRLIAVIRAVRIGNRAVQSCGHKPQRSESRILRMKVVPPRRKREKSSNAKLQIHSEIFPMHEDTEVMSFNDICRDHKDPILVADRPPKSTFGHRT